jgi:hypothetical protein
LQPKEQNVVAMRKHANAAVPRESMPMSPQMAKKTIPHERAQTKPTTVLQICEQVSAIGRARPNL